MMSLKDDTDEIRIYNITNPHVQGMFIGHVVKANVVYVTDLISPRGTIERSEQTVSVGEALQQIRHHRRHHRGRPRHDDQAKRHRGGAGVELKRWAYRRPAAGRVGKIACSGEKADADLTGAFCPRATNLSVRARGHCARAVPIRQRLSGAMPTLQIGA